MTTIEAKREEFRRYLEESGVVAALTKALIKLYEDDHKPTCAVKYVRQQMCETCPTEEDFEALKIKYEHAITSIDGLEEELTKLQDNLKRSPSEVAIALESGFLDLEQDDTCHSLLKKCLTREVFEKTKELKTTKGSTLLDCIQSGLENHDAHVGVYAPDAEVFTVFADLFDPIIEEYHMGFAKDAVHPESEWGDPTTLQNPDPDGKFIISTRVRCGRSVEGYPLVGKMNEQQYRDLMGQVETVLVNMEDEFKGEFHPLLNMDKDEKDKLIGDHFLFEQVDKHLKAARASRFWPKGRAIFFNSEKTFLVWINEEDHIRLISMQPGGDLGMVYQRLVNGVQKISEHLKFVRDPRLGFVTFCPTNMGTSIRASVHIKLPNLGADCQQLREVAGKYNLQVRGTGGENSDAKDFTYDISNKRRMGLTEYEAVKEMMAGINEIIRTEIEMQD